MIHNLKPYSAYKDSGVPWLGKVPAHWEVRRLKSLLTQPITDGPHLTPQFLESGVPFLSVDGIQQGELVFKDCRYISAEDHAEFSKKAAPRRDDILLGKAASTGKIARVKVDFPFNIWSPLALIRTDLKETQPTFLEYALKDVAAQAQIETFCTLNTQKNISMDDISKLRLALPPLPEQTAIARFLDHADRRIRRYIRAKQKLSALLEEQKQAIIHQAVTGQIDVRTGQPYPAYKPSGVEWLGDVPAHWEVRRIKQCVRTISKGTTPSTEGRQILEFGHIRFLKAENVTSGEIVDKPLCYIDEDTNNLLRRSQLQRGDILFVIAGATLGKTAVVRQELLPANTNQAVAFIRPHKRIVSSYLAFWLQSPHVKELTWLNAVQSAQPNLSMTNLGNFLIPFSSLPEQASIVKYLNKTTADVDTAIAHARRQIDLLHEYRTRLIADVVTGKLDVREAAAALPEGDPRAVEDELGDTHAAPEVLPGG